ncbi:hypothetical protein NFI96_017818 [Prochilodus magdalenae]|nr:hypothetical protein NFI96_017818 [Prochilodus magdalenae]
MVSYSMTAHTAALLLLVLVFCSSGYAGAEGQDCCLTTKDKSIPRRLVKEFYMQTVDTGCRVPATVFVTKKGIKLCAPPPTKHKWVRKLIDDLKLKQEHKNKLNRRSKGNKH